MRKALLCAGFVFLLIGMYAAWGNDDRRQLAASRALLYVKGDTMYNTAEELLVALSAAGIGASVLCSGSCSVAEIAAAQAHGRWFVREDGIGFVLRPAAVAYQQQMSGAGVKP